LEADQCAGQVEEAEQAALHQLLLKLYHAMRHND
jgi:hypothetical protein